MPETIAGTFWRLNRAARTSGSARQSGDVGWQAVWEPQPPQPPQAQRIRAVATSRQPEAQHLSM